MASTYTTNAHLELQGTGDNVGTWGSELNSAVTTIIDNVFGAVQTISLSSTDVTLTTTQTQVATIKLTGVLTANVSVIFPAIGRIFFVQNSTTGNFTVTLKIAGSGATAIAPPNSLSGQFFILDGANVYADFGGTPPGKIDMFAMSAMPYGWLLCDGSAVSRTTYAALFSAIGTTYGTGNGSTTFNLPDARGYFPRAWDDSAGRDPGRSIGTTQTGAIQSHTHGVTDPGHIHSINTWHISGSDTATRVSSSATTTSFGTADTNSAKTGISIQSTGGTETRPINIAFAFAIKW